jgi:hypothetical protein
MAIGGNNGSEDIELLLQHPVQYTAALAFLASNSPLVEY